MPVVLYLGNAGDDDAGTLGRRLSELGWNERRLVREDAEMWPPAATALDGVDLVVSLGSEWSVHDEHAARPVEVESVLLREADRSGVAVLGVCFGGQMLARTLGGEVRRNPRPEIGWREVTSSDESLIPSGVWPQWHSDGFTPPPDATVVATSDTGCQGFVLRRCLALQFHPEADGAILARWARGDESPAQMADAGTDAGRLAAESAEHDAENAPRAARLLDAFLARTGPE